MVERRADIVIVGGGTGACAAALAACMRGRTVLMTEPTQWIGGQFTSQGVPADEHRWIEHFGCSASYRRLRNGIRDYYRRNFPLSPAAQAARFLNPGGAECSSISAEPRAALAALHELLAPHIRSSRLEILYDHAPVSVECEGDEIRAVRTKNLLTGDEVVLVGDYFIDASEFGDLLELAGAEYALGAESRAETGEPHALEHANPRCMEAITWCFAMDHVDGDHTIDRPERYDHFRASVPPYWPGPQLSFVALDYDTMGPWHHTFLPPVEDGPLWESLWTHRRLIDQRNFSDGTFTSDIVLVNWTQNDYVYGSVVGYDARSNEHHLEEARQLSLSFLFWMQTEAPRPDGEIGWPGLRLRGDVMGTEGLAMHPYVRESRRMRAEFTLLEEHISAETRTDGAEPFEDTIGIGYYFIDMHQRTESGTPFLVQTWPYQLPLGILIPVRIRNLLPGCKNAGVTHVVNSATREHPIEWAIGEAAGTLVAYCLDRQLPATAIRARAHEREGFQRRLIDQGVELEWPHVGPVSRWDAHLEYARHLE